MLKALELVGFKSFVDRTRFDFPDGITVIVGPNGSGKSNIVDAIKWVLGSQSAKSLRGSDMADVIFKGSAVGGRPPANSAEATLVFDNATGLLPIDAPEVTVMRRVYRSGESEYLINRQPCRLKDIRDLFRGTGVGVDAYSLIEQGKVDRMLQASAKERRAIFEEAAGISRFKAKKVEAERRLSRVEQNLLRLNDIVEEVRGRLDSLKSQAAKAQRFREMSQHLQLLRTQIGLADRQAFVAQGHAIAEQHRKLTLLQEKLDEDLSFAIRAVQQAEQDLFHVAQQAQTKQTEQRDLKQQMVAIESQRSTTDQRLQDLALEKQLLQSRLNALRHRAHLTTEEVEAKATQLDALTAEQSGAKNRVQQLEKQFLEIESRAKHRHACVETCRDEYMNWIRQASEQTSIIAAEQSRLGQLEKTVAAKLNQLDQLEEQTAQAGDQLQKGEAQANHLRQLSEASQAALLAVQSQLDEMRRIVDARQDDSLALQGRLHGVRERLAVLQQLNEQQEGVGRGTRQILESASNTQDPPWNSVRGMVADLIEIDLHLAPLIDVALGTTADTVVLANGSVIDLLRRGQLAIEGRTSLMRIDKLPAKRSIDKIQLDGLSGVLGRADRLVHFQEEFEPLIGYLLGSTWLVDTLDTAIQLGQGRGLGLRFVTASCEKIDADGTIHLGSFQSALGLVARRSEMQAAREEIAHYDFQIQHSAAEIGRLQETIHELTFQTRRLEDESRNASREMATFAAQLDSSQKLLAQLAESQIAATQELDEARGHQDSLMQRLSQAHAAAHEYEAQAARTYTALQAEQELFRTAERENRELARTLTDEKINLARVEQRLEGLKATIEQLSRDHNERLLAVHEAQQARCALATKETDLNLDQLTRTGTLATGYLESERMDGQLKEMAYQAQQHREQLAACQKQRDALQRQVDRGQEKVSQLTNERQHQEANLAQHLQRFADDYEIDLSDDAIQADTPGLENRESAETEIQQLRQDIALVGAVNMEALRELDELQSRFDTLDTHYRDLSEAKEGLHRIIARINQDSRRLFTETLEAVRQNFQILYRKSFGGGSADIILDDSEDVLEAGVEIVATPPGKTAFSNSLLSGGEKALTAVALIMAIFQFRPSPFCVLDEVDAPFDEANIGRFVSVLNDFLDWTKFIVVTHSKKTMTAATTLYGVTMQESGVSKQVAVRFEDAPDYAEQHLSRPALPNKAA